MSVPPSTLNGRHRVWICHSLKNLIHPREHPHLWHIRKLGTRGARSPRATHLGGVGKGSCAVSRPELTSEFSLWVLSCCNGFFPDKQVLNSNKITLWCQEKKNDCNSNLSEESQGYHWNKTDYWLFSFPLSRALWIPSPAPPHHHSLPFLLCLTSADRLSHRPVWCGTHTPVPTKAILVYSRKRPEMVNRMSRTCGEHLLTQASETI